jgi:hypothetical protein
VRVPVYTVAWQATHWYLALGLSPTLRRLSIILLLLLGIVVGLGSFVSGSSESANQSTFFGWGSSVGDSSRFGGRRGSWALVFVRFVVRVKVDEADATSHGLASSGTLGDEHR